MKPAFLILAVLCGISSGAGLSAQSLEERKAAVQELLLKDYDPTSIFRISRTEVPRAKFPVIDMHSHDYAADSAEIAAWVRTLDSCNIRYSSVMHCEWIGAPFEEFVCKYRPYGDRFLFWCCFDYTGFGESGWAEHAVRELERCHALGARGVGEMVDKGLGDTYARPVPGSGIHLDDPRLRPLIERCGDLDMPISIHIAEPIWMYEPMDRHNDGLMNGANWAVDTSIEGCRDYEELMAAFERALEAYPGTTFIACHYLNMNQDLERLGRLLDGHPNLYVDIAGRIGESAVIPRATRRFLIKYADRVLFGTDNGMAPDMYRMVFRILETDDEHIYNPDYGYHWSYAGFHLPDDVLRKIYHDNAARLFHLD